MVLSGLTASAVAMAPIQPQTAPPAAAPFTAAPLQNRTRGSKSLYIASFEDSPVAWQLLDNESIERSRHENKLIFLHIGYKACHFCRLMALESFSNPECAAIINEYFIPVIVDREQRPDIDTIYMNYVQAVSNVGGWPLNVFITSRLEPVFGGTYWPGPGTSRRRSEEHEDEAVDFQTILTKVHNIWKDQEARCRKEATEVLTQLREFAAEGTLGTRGITGFTSIAPSGWAAPAPAEVIGAKETDAPVSSELDLDQLEEAYTHIAGTFDPVYGGFGLAPKFLTPPKLKFLLNLHNSPDAVQDVVGEAEVKHATDMALDTLRKVRDGALHDHIGATGFARCSVTPDWSIPNFEKLVVDNALLLQLYVEAWRASGGKEDSEFYEVVLELADYLSSSPISLAGGGFASSEAADSNYRRGEKDMGEGAYYLWTRREFDSVIEAAEKDSSAVVAAHWDVLEDGNVDQDHDPNDDFINQNILRIVKTPEELSKQFSIPVSKVEEYIRIAKRELKARREKDRTRPEIDDKVITGWNGLAVSALAQASVALKDTNKEKSEEYLKRAEKAVTFLQTNLWDAEKKVLYRIWREARETEGFADDYAYLIQGLLDLFEVNAEESLIKFADQLQTAQTSQFYDEAGAFFSTTESSPHTIIRLKDGMDTSLPSANAVSVSNLYRLAALLDDQALSASARDTINAFEAEMLQHPWLFPGLLAGVALARLGVQRPVTDIKYKDERQKA